MSKVLKDMPFSVPRVAAMGSASDRNDVFAAYHAVGDQVFSGFGFPYAGLMHNKDRVYILNQKGQLVLPEDNVNRMNKTVNAAADGCLFVRDKSNQLRQVSLRKGENGEYDFHISEPISKPVVPARPSFYFIKNLLSFFISSFREEVEPYNNWKNFDKAVTDFAEEYNKGKRADDANRFKFAPEKAQPLVQEEPVVNEPEVNQVEVKDAVMDPPEAKQEQEGPQISEKELLKMDPKDMSADQFETYLNVLTNRAVVKVKGEDTNLTLAVMEHPKSTAKDYYEALARELEGKIAQKILNSFATASADRKKEILEAEKQTFGDVSRDLREFVKNPPSRKNNDVVDDYFLARAAKANGEKEAEYFNLPMLKVQLMTDMQAVLDDGMSEFVFKESKVSEFDVVRDQVKGPEVNQPVVEENPNAPKMSAEELLKMNPMNLSTKQFENYLEALGERGDPSLVMSVIDLGNNKSTSIDYYEALAQQLESEVAKQLLVEAGSRKGPGEKEKFLEEQKPVIVSMSRGLRQFVENYPDRENKDLVNDFFRARMVKNAEGKEVGRFNVGTLQMSMVIDAMKIQSEGVGKYLAAVQKENDLARQQPQANQAQQPSVQQGAAQIQAQPDPEPAPVVPPPL